MMILSKVEEMYFNRMKSLGKLKPKKETDTAKTLKEINYKLPVKEN